MTIDRKVLRDIVVAHQQAALELGASTALFIEVVKQVQQAITHYPDYLIQTTEALERIREKPYLELDRALATIKESQAVLPDCVAQARQALEKLRSSKLEALRQSKATPDLSSQEA
jgi:hypothetical protein